MGEGLGNSSSPSPIDGRRGWGMRANPYSLALNYRFQDRRGLIAEIGRKCWFSHPKFSLKLRWVKYLPFYP
jgi:hypothetical protein